MKHKDIQRFSVAASAGGALQFAVDTEIMDYIEPARAFGAGDLADATASTRYQPRLIAVPDRRLDPLGPLVLALGRDRRLGLVRRSAGNATGWEQVDLSAQLCLQAEVLAFGAAAAPGADLVTIAVALRLPGEPARSRIFIAYDVSTEHDDWSRLPWVDYGAARLAVEGVRVWRDAAGIWMIALSGSDGQHQRPYLIRSDRPRSFDQGALVFSPAADLASILDYRAGAWRSGAASGGDTILHVLGDDAGGERLLSARPIAFDAAGQPRITPAYLFACEADARVLALGRDPGPARANGLGPGADLYVGGRGIERLPGEQFVLQEEADWETVVPPTLPSPVLRLLVADGETGGVTLWALLEDGQLVAVHRPAPDAGWGSPLFLRREVTDIAPSAGDGHLSASVLLVYRDGHAAHLWRDTDGVWQEATIHVPAPADAARVTCFGTTFTAFDASGLPRPLAPVRIRASAPSSLVINGEHHYVGPDLAVTVSTSFAGSLVLFNRAMSLAPASYRFELDELAQAIDVNPGTVLHRRFAAVGIDELRAATVPGGGPLLAPAYRGPGKDAALQAMVDALRKAAEMAAANDGVAAGVRLGPADGPFISDLRADQVGDGYAWAVATDAHGRLTPLAAGAAPAAMLAAAAPAAGDSISDFFQGLLDGVQGAARYLVRKSGDLIELVCEIGGRVRRWVVETWEQMTAFLAHLIDSLCTSAGDLLEYLKFLFDWEDIKTVRTLMADTVGQQLHRLRDHVGTLRQTTAEAFDGALAAVQAQGHAWDIAPSRRIAAAPPPRPALDDPEAKDPTAHDIMASGPGGWVMDQLSKLGKLLIDIEDDGGFASAERSAGMLDELRVRLDALRDDLGEDVDRIFGQGPIGLADLDLDKLQRLTLAVTFRVAEQGTLVLKAAALKLIELLDDVLVMFGQLLFARVRCPFFEKVEQILLASGAVALRAPAAPSGMRVVDIILLMPSVLTTIACKIIAGPSLDTVLARRRASAAPAPGVGIAGAAIAGIGLGDVKALGDTVKSILATKEALLVKGVGLRFVDYLALAWAATSAFDELDLPGPATAWSRFKLGSSIVVNVLVDAATLFEQRPAQVTAAEGLVYLCGVLHTLTEIHHFRIGPNISKQTVAGFSTAVAATQVMCHLLKVAFKAASYHAQDEAGRDGWALMIYCGSGTSKALVNGARLVKHPKAKLAMVGIGVAGNLALSLGPGVHRASRAYDAALALEGGRSRSA